MKKYKYISTFFILLFGIQSLEAQELEQRLNRQLDSLKQVVYTFNYADDSTDLNDFASFEKKLAEIAEESLQRELYPPYYKAQNLLFNHLRYQEDKLGAQKVLNKTIAFAEQRQEPSRMAKFIYFKGLLSYRFDDLDSAVLYFKESLALGRELDDYVLQASSINAIAVCFAQLDRDIEAIRYYRESKIIAETIQDSSQIITAFLNLGNAYGRLEIADSALYFSKIAYENAIDKSDLSIVWSTLNALSVAHLLNGDFEKVIEYSKDLEEQVMKVGENGFLMTSYLTRSKALAALGKKSEALDYALKSLEITHEFIAIDNEKRTLAWLVDLEKSLNDFRSALKHQERLTYIEDSLAKIEVNQRLESLAVTYETEKRKEEIKALQLIQRQTEDKLKFRNLMFLFLAISSLMVVVALFSYFRSKVEKEKLAQQKTKNELLRTQLNPHFLFNALSSIQLFLINQGQGASALEYLSKFAKLMRRILENSRMDFVSLEDEISTLRHYLDLQKMRFDNRFDYFIEVQVDDDLSEIKIPPMFAQPFIENSLEHGISSLDNGLIKISFEQHDDLMRFRVEDNGIGISRAAAMKQKEGHVSLATKITKDRIELLKRQLKKNISFNINDRLSDTNEVIGTEVIFEIPIQY